MGHLHRGDVGRRYVGPRIQEPGCLFEALRIQPKGGSNLFCSLAVCLDFFFQRREFP